MEYECKTHGIWDANKASGCPECVREMRNALNIAEKLCEIYFDIAAEVIGEEAVRTKRDEIISNMDFNWKGLL